MLSLSVKTVICLIFTLVYKPLNSVISIMLGRTLEMPSHALVENSFWDFPPPKTTHERFGDLFSRLYPGKSPSDLNGILILVKTSIYMTQAKWKAKEDKWADMHFPSLGREGMIGGSSINALTVSLWTLAHGKCFCQSVVGKGQCWSRALYSHGLLQFALTKNSHILFWVRRSAWGQDQCLNVIPTSRPNYMWPGSGRLEYTIVLKHKNKVQNENTVRGHFYACTSLAFFDQFPCVCWYSKALLSQNYFCYYVILCYFLFFCALLTFLFMLSGTHSNRVSSIVNHFSSRLFIAPTLPNPKLNFRYSFSWSISSTWPCCPHSPCKPLYLVLCIPHCLPSRSPLLILFVSWLCMLEGPRAPVHLQGF